MRSFIRARSRYLTAATVAALLLGGALFSSVATDAEAGPWHRWFHRHHDDGDGPLVEVGGEWHWIRSPDEERIVVSSLFNRYCIRCHGIDGRGVWDIPGVPDFTNASWQATRTDAMLARRIIEGRGAVMPTFRGVLSLEEAWAMARYLRTFVPSKEASLPSLPAPQKAPPKAPVTAPKVDAPKVDAPKIDAPKVDAPKVPLPKVDAPKVDAPKK